MSVNGNSSFTKVYDVALSGADLQNGVLDVVGGGVPPINVTNGSAAVQNLADGVWRKANVVPIVITGTSTADISLAAGEQSSAGAAAAAALQQALGLSNVGDSATIIIIKADTTNYAINILADSDTEVLAGAGARNMVEVTVTASNVTASSEACTFEVRTAA